MVLVRRTMHMHIYNMCLKIHSIHLHYRKQLSHQYIFQIPMVSLQRVSQILSASFSIRSAASASASAS